MLAFANKIFGIVIFPPQPAKRILNEPDEKFLTDGSGLIGWTSIQYIERYTCCQYCKHCPPSDLNYENLIQLTWIEQTFPSTAAHSIRSSMRTWASLFPPETQPEHQCHSDKWLVTGKAYQCQRQAALWDFDSALFPQLNRRLCFAKQTNKQGTWTVWWKSKQHGPVTCPITITLPK